MRYNPKDRVMFSPMLIGNGTIDDAFKDLVLREQRLGSLTMGDVYVVIREESLPCSFGTGVVLKNDKGSEELYSSSLFRPAPVTE